MAVKTFIIICLTIVSYTWCLEIIPERPMLDYYNLEYINSIQIDVRKDKKTSTYYINMDVDVLYEVGNNVTIFMKLLEYFNGRYQPTPIQSSYKLCDFFYTEPFLGQMYAKQLPANWSCPFKAGVHNFHNLMIHLENFPFIIPFTQASYSVKTRADIEGQQTDTKQLLFKWKCYVMVKQKSIQG